MKTATVPLNNTLKKSLAIDADCLLIAEWNQNRYAGIATVTNTATEEFDEDCFPLISISQPDRPKTGILKALTASRANTTPGAYTSSGYKDNVAGHRSYTVSESCPYKYWVSPVASSTTLLTSPSRYVITDVLPTVVYDGLAWANKIVVGFETGITAPVLWTIATTTDGTTWTTVSTNPTVDANGLTTLYRQANGTWSTTVYRDNPVQIKGLRVAVTAIDKKSSHVSMIQLSSRVESDLSIYVQEHNSEFTMSEHSMVTPLGVASSNVGDVTLSNVDGRFNDNNPSSLYYNIIDTNVEFRMDIGIDTTAYAGAGREYVRQFTMFADSWNGQGGDTVSVSLKDASKYLQSVKPNATLLQSMTVGELVWRLCDAVGFVDYKYDPRDDDPSTTVPYFWTDGTKTVWDLFNQLAQTTQTAIYFDEYNILQIQTRTAAYDLTKAIDWTLDFDTVTTAMQIAQSRPTADIGKLPDIIDLTQNYDLEANSVNVKYKTAAVSDYQNGFPIMETVWEPDGDVVLRSTALTASITDVATQGRFDPKDMAVWPYAGTMQLEGEFIGWDAKSYAYYDTDNSLKTVWLHTLDEKLTYDKKNPNLSYKNYFNGYLHFPVGGRGKWASTPMAHNVFTSAANYLCRYRTLNGAVRTSTFGFIANHDDSTLRIRTTSYFTPNSWYNITRGNSLDQAPYFYGTRMRFDTSGYAYGAGGIVAWAGTNDSGIHVELVRTAVMGSRVYTHELCVYVRYSDGHIKRFGPNGGRGIITGITAGQWYDMDVYISQDANPIVSVSINGTVKLNTTIPNAEIPSAPSGRWGAFARGFTFMELEYLYASTYSVYDGFDAEGWFDRRSGGYQSGQLMREWLYGWRSTVKSHSTRRVYTGKTVTYQQRYNQLVMDEFGPIAHELREYNVNFDTDKGPCIHSRLYSSNDTQVICPDYNATPFGAKFTLVNTARVNAIVKGEDSLTFGIDNTVEQKLLIYGRVVSKADEQKVTVKDDDAIARRGLVELDVDGEWIQTQAAATALGAWIIKHWAGGNDELDVSMNGNPLIQLGDLVAINYPQINMTRATHRYFVVEIRQSYDGGLSTSLVLRRAKI